jgi:hypothetical protein
LASSLEPDGQASFAKGGKPKISISKVTLSSNTVVINNPGTPYSITIQNGTTSSASTIIVQAEMEQGTTSRASGGREVVCGAASGVLPPGSCTMNNLPAFADEFVGGSGTFVPGGATLVINLYSFDGTTTTTLDTKSLQVKLVAGPTTPYFTSLSLDFSSLVIDGSPGTATVGIWNPGAAETPDAVQTIVNQPSASRAGGIGDVSCGNNPPGVLAHGNCSFKHTTSARNAGAGTGTLVAGPATLRFELLRMAEVRAVKEVGITLTNP